MADTPKYETVVVTIAEAVATVTLNRPDKLNGYTVQLGDDLVDAFADLAVNDEVRVIVLTGAGKAFCAGVDLDVLKAQFAGETPPGQKQLGEEHFVLGFCEDLLNYEKPVIVAFNGAAVGVGITMSLPCDIRIAARSAKLALPFVKLGILPGLGSTYLLPRIVGLGKAKELVMTGQKLTADQALDIGLVNHVVDDEQLLDFTLDMAKSIAQANPKTITAAKQALDFAVQADSFSEAVAFERNKALELRK